MKIFALTSFILCISFVTSFSQNNFHYQFQNTDDSTIVIDSAELYIDVKECIHAIAFNAKNELFVAGCHDVYKITHDKKIEHFVSLKDTSINTKIWSMLFNDNGDMFLAAKDRIIKITQNGEQTTLIAENYSGPAGATDIRFDKAGDLYVVYDNKVAKYNQSLEKTIVVDGSRFSPPIKWAVGIEFDLNEENLFLGDCSGRNLYCIPLKEFGKLSKPEIIPTNWGQYLTKDSDGNLFLTMFGPKDCPEFLIIKNDFSKNYLYCNKRPAQGRGNNKKAIAFKKNTNLEKEVFCIIGNKIYTYKIKL